jgi:hypothetical protein
MKINWDQAFNGDNVVLESGVDFEHGRSTATMLEARAEAIRRGKPLKVRHYQRLSEVDLNNRPLLRGKKFPLVVLRAFD